MKRPNFSPTIIMILFASALLALVSIVRKDNNSNENDNKSKLTLQKVEQKVEEKALTLKSTLEKNLKHQEEVANSQNNNETVLTLDRHFTEQEILEMNEGSFTELIKDTQRRLPKLSDIKKLPPGVLHRTPEIIIQAGRDLGVIKEVLKVHESFERVAVPFYNSCAKNQESPTPVRALCLTNLIFIKKKNGAKINLNEFPSQLVELSKMVTDI